MQESLTGLIRRGQDIASDSDLKIHYPEDGHLRLSSVEEEHFWFTQRRDLVRRLLHRFLPASTRSRDPSAAPVGIDVGCGSGYTSVWLTEQGIPTYGQDVYRGFGEFQKQGRGLGFLQGDITKIDPVPEFDFALLLDVIEHIPDDKGFVDHVGKLLKPGGLLIVTVPAFSWLWSSVDDSSGHLRRYVKRDLSAFEGLSGTRFSIEFASYFYGSTLPLYFLSRMAMRLRSGPRDASTSAELTPGPLVNASFKSLLRAEAAVCLATGVPIGSSLVSVLRKRVD